MPVILIEKDPFVEDVVNTANLSYDRSINIRRPLHGTLNKKDQFSHLSLRAVDKNGRIRPLVINNTSAPGGESVSNYNYIVQNFSLAKQEKVQIIETFGDEYVFFYGERPTVVQVQGFLINSPDFNWRSEWYQNYDNYLRGTKCVERRARVYLYLDGLTFVGYIMTTATQIQDAQPRLTPFSFSMLVTNYFDTAWASAESVKSLEEARVENAEYLSGTGYEYGYKSNYDLGAGALDEFTQYSSSSQSPESVESTDSAFWLGGPESGLKQFYKEDEAIREIAVREYMNNNNVSRFEAVQAFNSGSTIFSSATAISTSFFEALGKGAQGSVIRV